MVYDLPLIARCAFIVLGLSTLPAYASTRTFVASTGNDSGSCTRSAPCRSFAFAVSQTAPGGELDVLDSGGYGVVTITQSISIINPTGNVASVSALAGTNAITINAGSNDSVTLRGLTLEGSGVGQNGIVLNSGKNLTIRDCIAQDFTGNGASGNGLLMQPTSGSANIIITGSTFSNNGSAGIRYSPQGTVLGVMTIDRVVATQNALGLSIDNNLSTTIGTLTVGVSNTVASENFGGTGMIFGAPAGQGKLTAAIDSSYAIGNSTGISVFGASATLFVGRSTVLGNNNGFYVNNNGTLNTYGNNQVNGNGQNDVFGSITPVGSK